MMALLVVKLKSLNDTKREIKLLFCVVIGTSRDDDDYEYIELRADFESAEEYGRFVRERIKEGMLVQCCESVESIDLYFGQTGTVVAVNRDIEFNVQVIFNCISCFS